MQGNELMLMQKLLEELESLEVPADIREARLETLKREAAEFADMHDKQHGQYTYVNSMDTGHYMSMYTYTYLRSSLARTTWSVHRQI